jgi:hypothetical protein
MVWLRPETCHQDIIDGTRPRDCCEWSILGIVALKKRRAPPYTLSTLSVRPCAISRLLVSAIAIQCLAIIVITVVMPAVMATVMAVPSIVIAVGKPRTVIRHQFRLGRTGIFSRPNSTRNGRYQNQQKR